MQNFHSADKKARHGRFSNIESSETLKIDINQEEIPDDTANADIAFEEDLNFPATDPSEASILQTMPSAPAVYTLRPWLEYATAVTPLNKYKTHTDISEHI